MNKDLKFELRRKFFHFLSLIYILIYIYISQYFSHRTALLTLTFIFIILLFIEFIKIKYNRKVPLFQKLYRKGEKDHLSGSIYLILGAIIAFAVFDFEIAVTALLMVVFGDIASCLVGLSIGKHWMKNIPHTSWEGVFAEFVVNIIIGFLFLKIFIIVLIMALVATFVETVLSSSDDNLAVPLLSGFAGQATLIFLRIFGLV